MTETPKPIFARLLTLAGSQILIERYDNRNPTGDLAIDKPTGEYLSITIGVTPRDTFSFMLEIPTRGHALDAFQTLTEIDVFRIAQDISEGRIEPEDPTDNPTSFH